MSAVIKNGAVQLVIVNIQNEQQSCSCNFAFAKLFLLSILAYCMTTVSGLACYETNNGFTTVVEDDSWTYCVLVPHIGDGQENGSQHGLGSENDMLGAYNTVFAMSADQYRILSVCIYERYDFSAFMKGVKPEQAVEFTFRCVCNYNLCNSGANFSAYLGTLKSESFTKRN